MCGWRSEARSAAPWSAAIVARGDGHRRAVLSAVQERSAKAFALHQESTSDARLKPSRSTSKAQRRSAEAFPPPLAQRAAVDTPKLAAKAGALHQQATIA